MYAFLCNEYVAMYLFFSNLYCIDIVLKYISECPTSLPYFTHSRHQSTNVLMFLPRTFHQTLMTQYDDQSSSTQSCSTHLFRAPHHVELQWWTCSPSPIAATLKAALCYWLPRAMLSPRLCCGCTGAISDTLLECIAIFFIRLHI